MEMTHVVPDLKTPRIERFDPIIQSIPYQLCTLNQGIPVRDPIPADSVLILEHQHIDLLGKPILEHMVFVPPMKYENTMDNEACFTYVVNGSSTLFRNTNTVNICSEEAVLLRCGTYLNRWHSRMCEEPAEVVVVHFYPEVLRHVYKDELPSFLTQEENRSPEAVQKINADEMIGSYAKGLLFYFENPALVTEELIVLKIKELFLLLVKSENGAGVRELLQNMFSDIDYSMQQVIEEHLLDDLSVEELALLCNLSTSSFKRRFRELYATSPAQYIKGKRLEKAADLLKLSSSTISEICYDCGFNDIGHFSKSFKAHYGITPTEFRKEVLA